MVELPPTMRRLVDNPKLVAGRHYEDQLVTIIQVQQGQNGNLIVLGVSEASDRPYFTGLLNSWVENVGWYFGHYFEFINEAVDDFMERCLQ